MWKSWYFWNTTNTDPPTQPPTHPSTAHHLCKRYFGGVGAPVEIVTEDIDYFEQQAELADIADRLSGFGDSNSPYIQVRSGMP